MANPNKSKGTRWESAVRDYLNEQWGDGNVAGLRAYRPAQEGFRDTGDIHGVSPFVIQAKDWKDVTAALRVGLDGAVQQAANAGEEYGVNVVKRARKPVGEAYAVMRLSDFAEVVLRLALAERA